MRGFCEAVHKNISYNEDVLFAHQTETDLYV